MAQGRCRRAGGVGAVAVGQRRLQGVGAAQRCSCVPGGRGVPAWHLCCGRVQHARAVVHALLLPAPPPPAGLILLRGLS